MRPVQRFLAREPQRWTQAALANAPASSAVRIELRVIASTWGRTWTNRVRLSKSFALLQIR